MRVCIRLYCNPTDYCCFVRLYTHTIPPLIPPYIDMHTPFIFPQNTASLSGTIVVYPGNVQARNGMLQLPTSGSGAALRPACTFDAVGTLYMERDVISVCMESSVRPRHFEQPGFGQRLSYGFAQLANLVSESSVYAGYEYATMDGCPENPGTSCA